MEEKKFKLVTSKKTRYLLPNILTLAGVCLGISSIKFSIDGNFSLAVTLILFAAILDALDGRIARLIKGTSEFGKELDSLTDFVSFGIAPVFILYFWELNNYGKLGWAITLIYSELILIIDLYSVINLTSITALLLSLCLDKLRRTILERIHWDILVYSGIQKEFLIPHTYNSQIIHLKIYKVCFPIFPN